MKQLASTIRTRFSGTIILNDGYDARTGNTAINERRADLISFGASFLANPDLPERFRRNDQVHPADVPTFYVGEETVYTDYPTLKEEV